MGKGFSKAKLKVNLMAATKRMDIKINKQNQNIKRQRRAIAGLLVEGKDESARIQVEGLLQEIDNVSVLEVLKKMCEQMHHRVNYIASERDVPEHVKEFAATIIYSMKRVEIEELKEVVKQFRAHFGKEWVHSQLNNSSNLVNAQVVEKLLFKPPEFEAVLQYLMDIAQQYEINWQPEFDESSAAKGPEKLGAVAPRAELRTLDPRHLEEKGAPDPNYRPSAAPQHGARGDVVYEDEGLFPGTLNVTVYEARKLFQSQLFGKQDPYARVQLLTEKNVYQTRVMRNADKHAYFVEEHFPFHVRRGGMQLYVELYNKNTITADDLIGKMILPVAFCVKNPSKGWYRIGRGKELATDAGEVCLSFQYMQLQGAGDEHAGLIPLATHEQTAVLLGEAPSCQPMQPMQPQPVFYQQQPMTQQQPMMPQQQPMPAVPIQPYEAQASNSPPPYKPPTPREEKKEPEFDTDLEERFRRLNNM